MERDFTIAQLHNLYNQIEDVGSEWYDYALDTLGDLWITLMDVTNIVPLTFDKNNADEYFRKVLDQKNISCNELNDIFDSVMDLDTQYGSDLNDLNFVLSKMSSAINGLTYSINPDVNIFSSQAVLHFTSGAMSEMNHSMSVIENNYDEHMSVVLKTIAKNGVVDFVKAAIDTLYTPLVEFSKCILSGDFVGALAAIYKTIDSFFTACQNLAAVVLIPIGLGMSAIFDNNRMAYKSMKISWDYENRDGLADEWRSHSSKDGDFYDTLADLTESTGYVVDIYDYCDSVNDLVDGDVEVDTDKPKANIDKPKYDVLGVPSDTIRTGKTIVDYTISTYESIENHDATAIEDLLKEFDLVSTFNDAGEVVDATLEINGYDTNAGTSSGGSSW